MRLPTFILALAVSAFAALPALAETYKTPKALLKALYSYDTDRSDAEAPSPYSIFFSDHLNKLLQADLDNTPEGDVGAVDFDPVIAGQDGEASNVRIGQPILLDDKAEVEVAVQKRRRGDAVLHFGKKSTAAGRSTTSPIRKAMLPGA